MLLLTPATSLVIVFIFSEFFLGSNGIFFSATALLRHSFRRSVVWPSSPSLCAIASDGLVLFAYIRRYGRIPRAGGERLLFAVQHPQAAGFTCASSRGLARLRPLGLAV